MIKSITLLFCFCLFGITGCATTDITAPVTDFGAHCDKTPINVWDYRS